MTTDGILQFFYEVLKVFLLPVPILLVILLLKRLLYASK